MKEGQSDAHLNHTFHLFFSKVPMSARKKYCCWPSHVLLLCMVAWTGQNTLRMKTTHALYRDRLLWSHNMDSTAFAFLHKLKMHRFLTYDLELCRPSPSGEAGSFIFYLFIFCCCLANAASATAYVQNPLARQKSCYAVRLYLIVIHCLNDSHISCYCGRFLLESGHPTAVHCLCAHCRRIHLCDVF